MKSSHPRTAFTLLELLVVMVIIGLVLSFTIPVLNSTVQGIQLTQGAQTIVDQIHLARQTALTKNHAVEVRFYQYADSEAVGTAGKKFVQAVQSFELNDDGTFKPVGKMQKVPNSILLDTSATLSTLLNQINNPVPKPSIPGVGVNYDAYTFRFRPDGSADLAATGHQWFVTLHHARAGDKLTSLPHDFAVLQIDPWNGQTRLFRP